MKALLVAQLTLKRMFRAQYLGALAILAVVVVLLFLTQSRHVGNHPILILQSCSMSLFMILNVLCVAGAIVLGVTILPGEISSGHMRMNLTKPTTPLTILLGHFLGMFAYIAGSAMLLSILLTVAVALKGGEPGLQILFYVAHLLPLYGCYLALSILLNLVISRPLAVFSLLLLANESFMRDWAQKAAGAFEHGIIRTPFRILGEVGYAISPPIDRLKIKLIEFVDLDFPVGKYLLILAYCLSYILVAHLLATAALRRKEI